MTRSSRLYRIAAVGLMAASALATASCGDVATTGRAPALIIIDSMAASAGEDTTYTAFLLSDVQTGGGVFNDNGRATMRLAMKNPGANPLSPVSPSLLNEITLTRYHVKYVRADGRNTQGVDIPYEFDGGLTATITGGSGGEASFVLVRHQAKREPPLRNMWDGGGMRLMSAIAEVTFYGRDQAGNEVTAVGYINITFGDFADPS